MSNNSVMLLKIVSVKTRKDQGYKTLPGEGGFQMGPTVGLSGGKGVITGYVGLSFLGTYDSRAGIKAEPDISMGIRIRLFRK